MLDNVELVQTLEETKTKATEVMDKLTEAVRTSADIEKLRDGYRPAAKRGKFCLPNLFCITEFTFLVLILDCAVRLQSNFTLNSGPKRR